MARPFLTPFWESAPKGSHAGMRATASRGMEAASRQRGPQNGVRNGRGRAIRGGLSLGYFSLAAQRKVTRPRCENRIINSYTTIAREREQLKHPSPHPLPQGGEGKKKLDYRWNDNEGTTDKRAAGANQPYRPFAHCGGAISDEIVV